MSLKEPIRIGTRASPLALAQAQLVRKALMRAHDFAEDQIVICAMTTSGDRIENRSLADEGGKGLFTKEIEEALLTGNVDMAVHSAKDMAGELPRGLTLAACLAREDARDCLIGKKLNALPQGAKFGTSSPRRAALIRRLRPDLHIVNFRGNVETRLRKIAQGETDATMLALAGLKRLGLEAVVAETLDVETFPPAVGQGTIVIEIREDDEHMYALLSHINHPQTFIALQTERAYLGMLEGSCRTPIAGYATVADQIAFHGMILSPEGAQFYQTRMQAPLNDAEALGRRAAQFLKSQAPVNFFEAA